MHGQENIKLYLAVLCVRLHVSVLTWPSSGLLTNQVNRCWLHVGIPTVFTIKTAILCLANECTKFYTYFVYRMDVQNSEIIIIITNNLVFPNVCIYIRKVTSMVKYFTEVRKIFSHHIGWQGSDSNRVLPGTSSFFSVK